MIEVKTVIQITALCVSLGSCGVAVWGAMRQCLKVCLIAQMMSLAASLVQIVVQLS